MNSTMHPLRFNPYFAQLPAYNAGLSLAEARQIGGVEPARLASNENPYGCSPAAKAALQGRAFEPWRYSESDSWSLRKALSDHLHCGIERIVVSNGSEALIAAISRAFLEPDELVVTVIPSFGLHEIEPLSMGAVVRKVPMRPDLEFDIDALEEALQDGPRIVFLSSPSNPVGTTIDVAGFRRLLAAVRPGTLFVFDEAYVEFQDSASSYDSLLIAAEFDIDFVSLRTFSKAYGLAGLRVGYGIASSPWIADLMRAALTPFNVNAAAQVAAAASLGDEAWLSETTAAILAGRQRLADRLAAAGVRAIPSQGNFLFVDTGEDATEVAAALLSGGVIVKPWREEGYKTYIRVSIGLPEDMDRFLSAFAAIIR